MPLSKHSLQSGITLIGLYCWSACERIGICCARLANQTGPTSNVLSPEVLPWLQISSNWLLSMPSTSSHVVHLQRPRTDLSTARSSPAKPRQWLCSQLLPSTWASRRWCRWVVASTFCATRRRLVLKNPCTVMSKCYLWTWPLTLIASITDSILHRRQAETSLLSKSSTILLVL